MDIFGGGIACVVGVLAILGLYLFSQCDSHRP